MIAGDACPTQPGLPGDGCPPRDRDGDGVADRADGCPEAAGPAAGRGCPDRDGDGDRVVDRLDRCPERAGDRRAAGCPPADRDRDGLVDLDDRCPDRAEVWNGNADRDGCPDLGPARLVVSDGRLVLRGRIAVGRRGELTPEARVVVGVAVRALAILGARRARVEVVAEHGASYGHSVEAARALAGQVAAGLIAAGFAQVAAVGRGPDGRPRVEVVPER